MSRGVKPPNRVLSPGDGTAKSTTGTPDSVLDGVERDRMFLLLLWRYGHLDVRAEVEAVRTEPGVASANRGKCSRLDHSSNCGVLDRSHRLVYLFHSAEACEITKAHRFTAACGGSTRSRSDTVKPAKNTICLWYDGDAEEAARFYAGTFPDSSVGPVTRAPGDFPSGKKGDVLMVWFTVMGIGCLGLNGGPSVKHNWAFSFQVATADQAETDRYWNAIVGNGGQENACGWCQDRWGLSWQITPIALTRAVNGPDPAAAKRAFDAMMMMKKIDVAAIEAAVRG
jgi:2-polyprenyl-6-hydroxyphenyl methylase/3-demethylubiquinone-9 3-methyltransferase